MILKFFKEGTFTYKFSYELPMELPLNFEEKTSGTKNSPIGFLDNFVIPENGLYPINLGLNQSYIRYFATAYVEHVTEIYSQGKEETQHNRSEKKTSFKVVENFDPKLLTKPAKVIKTQKSILFGGSPIDVEISIANGCVLFSGQKVYLRANINNKSNRNIDKLIFRLEEVLTLNGKDPQDQDETVHRRETIIDTELQDSKIESGKTFNQVMSFQIPTSVPGTIRLGNFIQRHYELNFVVDIAIAGDIEIKTPILILEWSPQLKDIVPEVVPINLDVKKDDGNDEGEIIEDKE